MKAMSLRLHLMKLVHETKVENFLRRIYQFYKWNMPEFLLFRATRLEILFDKKTVDFARSVVNHDSVVVDVGANSGSILKKLSKLTPNGKQIAFEPIPFFAGYLMLKFPNCDIREIALSDRVGDQDFFNTFESPALSSLESDRTELSGLNFKKFQVRTDTLDNQLDKENRVDFIKIDVEGHELSVLRGSKSIIKRFHPALVVEVSRNTELDVTNFLRGESYEVSYLLQGSGSDSGPNFESLGDSEAWQGYLKAVYRSE